MRDPTAGARPPVSHTSRLVCQWSVNRSVTVSIVWAMPGTTGKPWRA